MHGVGLVAKGAELAAQVLAGAQVVHLEGVLAAANEGERGPGEEFELGVAGAAAIGRDGQRAAVEQRAAQLVDSAREEARTLVAAAQPARVAAKEGGQVGEGLVHDHDDGGGLLAELPRRSAALGRRTGALVIAARHARLQVLGGLGVIVLRRADLHVLPRSEEGGHEALRAVVLDGRPIVQLHAVVALVVGLAHEPPGTQRAGGAQQGAQHDTRDLCPPLVARRRTYGRQTGDGSHAGRHSHEHG